METPRQAWEAAKLLDVFLQDHEHVLRLLAEGEISMAKAIESLSIYRAGNVPALPEVSDHATA